MPPEVFYEVHLISQRADPGACRRRYVKIKIRHWGRILCGTGYGFEQRALGSRYGRPGEMTNMPTVYLCYTGLP
jgi:hypothetical protein